MEPNFKINWCKHFPPKGYIAITLFNNVIFRCESQEEFDRLIESDYGKSVINHERIHVIQGKTLGWFKFYCLYFNYYIIGRIRGLSHDEAYYNIPFEREAYANEDNPYYNQTQWESYIVYD